MAKYNREVVEKICKLLSSDSYTVQEVCDMVGITRSTFYKWEREKKQFAHLIKKAREQFEANMIAEAKKSLRKKITGYEVEETRFVLGKTKEGDKPIVKEKVVTKKHVAPDTTALIFFLSNKAPDEFKNRHTIDGNVALEHRLSGLSDAQLNGLIDQIVASHADSEQV